ncbi:glycosyltransferase family 4 protein [Sinomonas sp. RB5]
MERMLVTAADAFREQNIEGIVVGQGSGHPFARALIEAGYETYEVDKIGASWKAAKEFRRVVESSRPDVVHIHTEGNYLRTVLTTLWATGGRAKMIRTVHNVFDARGAWRVRRTLQARLGDRLMYAVVSPSEDVADNERRMGRRSIVIHNWVDERFYALRAERTGRRRVEGAPTAIIVGNCSSIKNHELAISAVMQANHRLIHIGDEAHASHEERSLLDRLDAQGVLLYRGTESPDKHLLDVDYFVMPSRREGMPVALAEAIAAGVPALVNDVPGMRWASAITNVRTVADTREAWAGAVRDWASVSETNPSGPELDLRASRGAREYAELYRASTTEH